MILLRYFCSARFVLEPDGTYKALQYSYVRYVERMVEFDTAGALPAIRYRAMSGPCMPAWAAAAERPHEHGTAPLVSDTRILITSRPGCTQHISHWPSNRLLPRSPRLLPDRPN